METIMQHTRTRPRVERMKVKAMLRKTLLYTVLVAVTLSMILPMLWMVSASLKSEGDIFGFPIKWIPSKFYWTNYVNLWTKVPFLTYYLNTMKVTLSVTFIKLVTCSLAAYAFAKIRFPERDNLFLLYLSTMMIPFQVMMIPQFILMTKLGLTNTHWSLVLMGATSAFGVFLLRQFFLTIPEELSESARIDGLSDFGIYARMVMPLSKPAIVTLIIFTFMTTWNDFLGPLLYLTNPKLYTIQLGIQAFFSEYSAEYALLMGAAVCSIIPMVILFFAAQNAFVEGVASSGIKG